MLGLTRAHVPETQAPLHSGDIPEASRGGQTILNQARGGPGGFGDDKKSLFEPLSFDRIDAGLHVVARFGGFEDDHLYPGTVYDAGR